MSDWQPDPSGLIVCETTAAITTHLRILDGTPGFSGYSGKQTLCGFDAGWDTKAPVPTARCRDCLAVARSVSFAKRRQDRVDPSGSEEG